MTCHVGFKSRKLCKDKSIIQNIQEYQFKKALLSLTNSGKTIRLSNLFEKKPSNLVMNSPRL